MKTNFQDNVLTIFLEGRVNTGNASDIEKEILDSLEDHPDASLVINAKDLE